MNNILFEGVYSATFSIYDENMNVKKKSVEELIDFNLRKGIKGFYVGGNTGECTVLPNKTRKQMLEAVKNCAKDAQIIAHVGSGHLEDVVDLIKHANEVGVDAIASLPPSLTAYYRPEEIVDYYKHIASLTDKPVLAYVTPVLNCDVVWYANEIMKIKNVIGIKMSIADYYRFERLKCVNDGNINILNGPDESMLSGLVMGADGAIGTTYNFMPETACNVYNNFKQDNIETALENQKKLNDCIDILFHSNIGKWKSMLNIIGIDAGHMIAPGRAAEESVLEEVKSALKAAGCLETL